MAQQYDDILKEDFNYEETAKGLLTTLFGIQPDTLQVLPVEIPQTIERDLDFIFRQDKTLWHLEFQATSHFRMEYRMYHYSAILHDLYDTDKDKDLTVNQYVIYLGADKCSMKTELLKPAFRFTYQLLVISELEEDKFLLSDLPEIVILAILAKCKDPEATAEQILMKISRLCAENPNDFRRFALQLRTWSQLRNLQETVTQLIKKMPLVFDKTKDPLFQEGKDEGILKKQTQTVLRMYHLFKYEIERIAEIEQLTVEEVEKILKTNQLDTQ